MALKFRTEVNVGSGETKISHGSRIVTLGSCFSDEIGSRLERNLFNIAVNPVGTLYNPMSIAIALDRLMSGHRYTQSELVCRDGVWHSFEHHSRFSSTDAGMCLDRINDAATAAREALMKCTHLIVTFGTAYVYTRDGRVVANCHKFPAAEFVRSRMSVDDILSAWLPLLSKLKAFNPALRLIYTISPIRHLADGAHGNQLSKATLQLATDAIIRATAGYSEYFPAYELVLDDLRDYRFYASDLVHPSDMAVEYIYDKFADMFFTPDTVKLAVDAGKLVRFVQHRPLTDDKDAYAAHTARLRQQIKLLLDACPEMEQAVNHYFHNI